MDRLIPTQKKPVFFDHFDPNCSIRVRPLANGLYDMPPQGFRRLLSRKFGSVAAPACLKRRRADLRGVRPNPGPTQWILRQRLGVFLWIQMAMVKFPSAGILGKIFKVSVTPKWLGILKHETSNFRNSHCLPGFTKASSIIDVGRWASLGTCESGGPQRFRDVLVTGSTNVGFKTRWVIPGWVLVGCLPIKAVMIPSWQKTLLSISLKNSSAWPTDPTATSFSLSGSGANSIQRRPASSLWKRLTRRRWIQRDRGVGSCCWSHELSLCYDVMKDHERQIILLLWCMDMYGKFLAVLEVRFLFGCTRVWSRRLVNFLPWRPIKSLKTSGRKL